MLSIHAQYITDNTGKKISAILPIKEFKTILENLEELDRFCEAMISIRKEIEASNLEDKNNVLKNSPHTLAMLTADIWNFPYTREQAAFPLNYVAENKFWPTVRRADDAFGDRNLVCSCAPIEAYMED